MSNEGKQLQDVRGPHEDKANHSPEYAIAIQYGRSVPIAIVDTRQNLEKQTLPIASDADISKIQHDSGTGSREHSWFVLPPYYKRDHKPHSTVLRRYPENLLSSIQKLGGHKTGLIPRMLTIQITGALIILLVTSGIIPLPGAAHAFKQKVSGEAIGGLHKLDAGQELVKNRDFQGGLVQFHQAELAFHHSLTLLQNTGQESSIMPYVVHNATYSSTQALLIAAEDAAKAGQNAARLAQNINNAMTKDSTGDEPFQKASLLLQNILGQNAANQVLAQRVYADLDHANHTLEAYAKDPVSDKELESARQQAWVRIPALYKASQLSLDLFNSIGPILGSDRNRRYLILFLNNTELRPGGGFIGSFATTVLKKGQISDFDVETNIYKQDNAFAKTARVESPYPISRLNPDWFMRDANWDVDYNESAARTAWFYKQEGGSDVDGVLSIDTSLLRSLLEVTGPIEVPAQHMTVTADNVVSTLEYKSEKEYLVNPEVNALNEPKKAIADMFPILLSRIFSTMQQDPGPIMTALSSMTKQKHLLFTTFFDQGEQVVKHTGLDNPLPLDDDFLMINNGNLGGLKSSLNMKQTVSVSVEATNRNTLAHTVIVTRIHNGSSDWPDGDNHNFTRIVVPHDAQYVSSDSNGKEGDIVEPTASIDQHANYQTFGHWLTTPIGGTRTATFKYETPLKTNLLGDTELKFHYIMQPGWTGDDLNVQFVNNSTYHFDTDSPTYHAIQKENALWQIPVSSKSTISGMISHLFQ